MQNSNTEQTQLIMAIRYERMRPELASSQQWRAVYDDAESRYQVLFAGVRYQITGPLLPLEMVIFIKCLSSGPCLLQSRAKLESISPSMRMQPSDYQTHQEQFLIALQSLLEATTIYAHEFNQADPAIAETSLPGGMAATADSFAPHALEAIGGNLIEIIWRFAGMANALDEESAIEPTIQISYATQQQLHYLLSDIEKLLARDFGLERLPLRMGDPYDSHCMVVDSTLSATDPSQHNTVAAVLRWGYRQRGQLAEETPFRLAHVRLFVNAASITS